MPNKDQNTAKLIRQKLAGINKSFYLCNAKEKNEVP